MRWVKQPLPDHAREDRESLRAFTGKLFYELLYGELTSWEEYQDPKHWPFDDSMTFKKVHKAMEYADRIQMEYERDGWRKVERIIAHARHLAKFYKHLEETHIGDMEALSPFEKGYWAGIRELINKIESYESYEEFHDATREETGNESEKGPRTLGPGGGE